MSKQVSSDQSYLVITIDSIEGFNQSFAIVTENYPNKDIDNVIKQIDCNLNYARENDSTFEIKGRHKMYYFFDARKIIDLTIQVKEADND